MASDTPSSIPALKDVTKRELVQNKFSGSESVSGSAFGIEEASETSSKTDTDTDSDPDPDECHDFGHFSAYAR
jgi:hypothetical protein